MTKDLIEENSTRILTLFIRDTAS
jgi:hypothetical protein